MKDQALGKFARKNLMVDPDKIRALVRRRGKSEAATVRELIDSALFADEFMDVIRELHDRGGIDDVFERVPMRADVAGNNS